ncbi:Proteasomal ATPase-associated factor 1 [Podila minutissima]|nr:Proteasomal ATPase-associated factor 1 [Podila minutissima]
MGIESIPPAVVVQVTVQADWTDVVADVLRLNNTASFWVSCYKRGSPSVHGSAKVSVVGDHKVEFTGDGIVLETLSNYSFTVKVPEYDNYAVKVFGTTRRTNIPKISCLDVSPEGALFVTGSEDGIIRVGETESGRMTQELKGHFQYVNSCQFFPSGQVILSGGGDFLLKIWSALDGSCPVTMKGHVKPISDTAIIDRGRNVVSSSNDGTVKLWEVASGTTIRTLASHGDRINAIDVGTWETPLESKIPLDSKEVATEGKLVVAVSENGTLYGLDVRASEEAFQRRSYNKAPLRSVAFSEQHSLVASGTSEGVVEVFDIRKQDEVLSRHQRSTAGISSLVFKRTEDSLSLVVGCDDSGLYETSSVTDALIQVRREYVGYDLDGPCRVRLVGSGPGLVSASKEGGMLRFSKTLLV